MSEQQTTERIKLLHDWYCRAMRAPVSPPDIAEERYWFDWIRAGYNGKQLRKVMNWLRKQIAREKRNPGSLKLRNLLDLQTFKEDFILSGASFDTEDKLPPTPESERK